MAIGLSFAAGPVYSSELNRPRNVLMIICDDLKPLINSFGPAKDGLPQIITPNMDRLAADGVVFTKSYCQFAVCGPSRASFLTGRLPDHTKVWGFGDKAASPTANFMRLSEADVVTLPEHFKKLGWHTSGVGKVFDGRCVQESATSHGEGFTKQDANSWTDGRITWGSATFRPEVEPWSYYAGEAAQAKVRELAAKGITVSPGDKAGVLKANGFHPAFESADVPDTTYADYQKFVRSSEILTERKSENKPFFLAVGFTLPHLPFCAPKKYWDMYNRNAIPLHPFPGKATGTPAWVYYNNGELKTYSGVPNDPKDPLPEEYQRDLIHGYMASVTYVDSILGKLLDKLDELGLKENTTIVLVGDHGFNLGDHSQWNKHNNLEEANLAPLIISGAGVTQKGKVVNTPVELLDIFPSLCDLTDSEKPSELDGVSLVPMLTGKTERLRNFARHQYERTAKGKKLMGYAIRTDRYRLIEWQDADYANGVKKGPIYATELYDYERDPNETKNEYNNPAYATTLHELQSALRTAHNIEVVTN